MPFEPIVPDGMHLGTSRQVEGAVTGHLFEDGTNELKGHAAWRWVEDPAGDPSADGTFEPSPQLTPEELEIAEKIAAVILVGIIIGVGEAAPHFKRWWNEHVAPVARSAWRRATAWRGARSRTIGSDFVVLEGGPSPSSNTDLRASTIDRTITMSRVEWETRFRAMMAARLFSDEQRRILENVRVEDDSRPSCEATEQLTAQEFADHLQGVLANSPSLLRPEVWAELPKAPSIRVLLAVEPGPATTTAAEAAAVRSAPAAARRARS